MRRDAPSRVVEYARERSLPRWRAGRAAAIALRAAGGRAWEGERSFGEGHGGEGRSRRSRRVEWDMGRDGDGLVGDEVNGGGAPGDGGGGVGGGGDELERWTRPSVGTERERRCGSGRRMAATKIDEETLVVAAADVNHRRGKCPGLDAG